MQEATPTLEHIRGIFCDLDGTLYVGSEVIEGAQSALSFLRARGIRIRFLSNSTTKSRSSLHEHAKALGLAVEVDEIVSAAYAGVLALRSMDSPRCRLILTDDTRAEYSEFVIDEENPEVVVIGDIGAAWDYDLLNSVFRQMLNGARLVALHKNRYYQTSEGLSLDVGAFCSALEYATGAPATVVGKPSEDFFLLAQREIGCEPGELALIGDDVENDVGAAQRFGIAGILVKTGKYRTELARESEIVPEFVLETIKSLPDLF